MPRDPALHPNDDRIRLTHMLEFAQRAARFCAGMTAEAVQADEMRLLAVLKCIETVGEASTKVSDATKERLHEIDWPGVRRMRNRLLHGYDTIDPLMVWDAVRVHVPPLMMELESALRKWPAGPVGMDECRMEEGS